MMGVLQEDIKLPKRRKTKRKFYKDVKPRERCQKDVVRNDVNAPKWPNTIEGVRKNVKLITVETNICPQWRYIKNKKDDR